MTINNKEMLKQLPQSPGVYLMFDSLGNIIYVGKAKNLKNRVSQYFRKQKDRVPKVEEMIRNIQSFEYQLTDTELDAFIEECRLIKEIKPKYNKQMKNSGNYLYIKIPLEQYPKVTIAKEKYNDGAIYFGPFTSRHRVEATIGCLNDVYPIRKCTSPRLVKKANGCLFQQLGSCLGVCTGQISPEDYSVYIKKIWLLLTGKDMAVVQDLNKRIASAIENLQFEKAAQYRNYYLGLRHVIGKQRLVQASSRNRNVIAVESINPGLAKFFLIKGNKLIFREVINVVTENSSELQQHIKQIIRDHFGTEIRQSCGVSQNDIDEAQIIYSYLKNNRRIICFSIPNTCLNKNSSSMDAKVKKIVERILYQGRFSH
ncbi:GIY-YIG nuclease family protein [Desulfosporosinus sp. SB140]|uniref:GIY-YIG nuclease family protein n=1 Tax=Desulfosporosinus paludis TaxID=3115649 RepID=UPI003890D4FD